MHRWAKCPGSVRLSDGVITPETSYAAEGTLAHDYASTALELIFGFKKISKLAKPSVEMSEAVRVYSDAIEKDVSENPVKDHAKHILIEHKFDLETIHPGLFGTGDCVIYHQSIRLMRVYDFKYGAGIVVDAYDNQQLKYYALGSLLSTGLPCEDVEIVIIQPRAPGDNIKRWRFKSVELLEFAADLKLAAVATEQKDAPIIAGEHCRFCPGAVKCTKPHELALEVAGADFKEVDNYDVKKLGEALSIIPKLKAWIKNVEEYAFGSAERGEPPTGFKLVAKRATRKWAYDDSHILDKLLNEFDLKYDDCTTSSVISPAKIEKIIPKDFKGELNNLVNKVSSGNTLAPISDKRVAISSGPQNEFKAIKQ